MTLMRFREIFLFKCKKMKIEIELIDLKSQQVTHTKEAFIELREKSFLYRVNFRSKILMDSDDPLLGWKEEEKNYFEVMGLKSNVCGVEYSLCGDGNFVVGIIVNGFANDLKIYFDKSVKGYDFYCTISDWLLK